MKLFRRFGHKKGEVDNSRELKRGEFKKILLPLMSDSFPDFEFVDYKNQCYSFQRKFKHDSYEAFERINICFSLKEKLCNCSVESRLNQNYVGTSDYNTGLVNPHHDLIVLKLKKGALTIEEASYHHSGRVEQTTETINEIIKDLEIHGRKFFEEQRQKLESDKMLSIGLKALQALGTLPQNFGEDIENELRIKEHVISRLEHPIYIELKEQLQSVEGLTRELRKEIPRMTYELLELKKIKNAPQQGE